MKALAPLGVAALLPAGRVPRPSDLLRVADAMECGLAHTSPADTVYIALSTHLPAVITADLLGAAAVGSAGLSLFHTHCESSSWRAGGASGLLAWQQFIATATAWDWRTDRWAEAHALRVALDHLTITHPLTGQESALGATLMHLTEPKGFAWTREDTLAWFRRLCARAVPVVEEVRS